MNLPLPDIVAAALAPAPARPLAGEDGGGLRLRHLGRVDYVETWQRMRRFALEREADTPDELWVCEHGPVYTQGLTGKAEHVMQAGDIPVVQTDRGGQVTYHGPGQVVAYPLVDLRRLRFYAKEYVFRLEAAALQVLDSYGVVGHRVAGAPGVYVRTAPELAQPAAQDVPGLSWSGIAKVAALGVKITNHCTYHGVALNVAMDLEPFRRIHPCGYAGLATVDLATLGVRTTWADAADRLAHRLAAHLTPPSGS